MLGGAAGFKTNFADYIGTSKYVKIKRYTIRLKISMTHYEVHGSEVFVLVVAFSDANSLSRTDITPILVDADLKTLSFDLEDLKRGLAQRLNELSEVI
jgi:dTDP-4-amino-4,6-dideoxygalactose transaminase